MHTVSPVIAGELSFVEGHLGGPSRGVSGDSGGSKAEGSYLKKKKSPSWAFRPGCNDSAAVMTSVRSPSCVMFWPHLWILPVGVHLSVNRSFCAQF